MDEDRLIEIMHRTAQLRVNELLLDQMLHAEQHPIEPEHFDLYVAPASARERSLHCFGPYTAGFDGEGELAIGSCVVRPVPSGACIVRCPIAVAVRSLVADAQRDQLQMALASKLVSDGHLSVHADGGVLMDLFQRVKPRVVPDANTDLLFVANIKAQLNTFMVGGTYPLALCKALCFVDHSCTPNCRLATDPVLREVSLYSLRKLTANEEVTFSYIPFPTDSVAHRRRLLSQFGFLCACAACRLDVPPSLAYRKMKYASASRHCWWCGTPTDKRCVCIARFCSAACRRADNQVHEEICGLLRKKFV